MVWRGLGQILPFLRFPGTLAPMDDFKSRVLTETAARHGMMIVDAPDFSPYGALPRLGAVLDGLRAKPPRHLQAGAGTRIGPFDFIAADSVLRRDGQAEIRLTEKERDILLTLYDAQGDAVARHALLDHVWGYASGVETHTLETHIYRLRQKIESDPAQPVLLLTRDDGYILKA